ncbi:hypothetical protein QBC46DRAFT_362116 [Diplogelasinospora grovesii]|uniref:Phosphoinositide phospholipase C n=1 Tax=Diplogelasinospora grovesii TaxID=303347 RepID=A0AAN6ND12_9PEZI|nr:hypothetical protein QBC46DRAFT_362116 [Diplogelasinospora grovesii]
MACSRRKKKKRSGFIRRMTTFRNGTPQKPGAAMSTLVSLAAMVGINKRRVDPDEAAAGLLEKRTGAWHDFKCKDSVRSKVQALYDELRGGDAQLSHEKLLKFLGGMQKEASFPSLEKESYDFGGFLFILHHRWGAMRPLRADEIDETQPISKYFISSSHNSYLEGNQITSKSSAEAYRRILGDGGRCIEIDVWNGSSSAVRTPSKSPNPSHRRHASTTTLPKATTDSLDTLKEPLEEVVPVATATSSNTSSPSPSALSGAPGPAAAAASDAKDGRTSSLDLKELSVRFNRSRASSRSRRGEPLVHHAKTLTTSVGFREVCQAIRESAFVDNDLPVIVSLEVGADAEHQELMVDIMKEEWGDYLLDRPHDNCNPKERQPRLDELKKKILIKVKRTDKDLSEVEVDRGRSLEVKPAPKSSRKPPVCDALAALAVYSPSEHFDDVKSLQSKRLGHIISVSESDIEAMAQDADQRRIMLLHNRDHFMRSYPDGLRVDSSNFDPSSHWREGVQMAALNWQTPDEMMLLNHAMFAGSKGWVLKPSFYRNDGAANLSAMPHRTIRLRITILSGQFLPVPEARRGSGVGMPIGGSTKFHPYVTVELHVEKLGKTETCVKHTKPSATQDPDWGDNPPVIEFSRKTEVVEELSFIKFKVKDDSNHFRNSLSAWACIRLDRLQPGYRFVSLLDQQRRPVENAGLFCRIEIERW